MEDKGKSINLFDTKASLSPGWQLVEKYLILARIYLLGFVCIGGALLVLTYGVVRVRTTQLDGQYTQLYKTIQGQSVKEGLLLALRARIASLKKILDVQFSLAPYIDTTLLIARPPELTSFSIGEKNTVQISVELPDIGQAISMMETVMILVEENKISLPNLTSLRVEKDGSIVMGITYSVLLPPAL
jgi:hypothetical protein